MIYDCALAPSGWQQLPATLAAAFGSERCLIHTRDLRSGACGILGATENLFAAGVSRYADHYFKMDVWAPGARKVGPGIARISEDLVSDQQVRESEFYQDFCRHLGIFHVAVAFLEVEPQFVGGIGIHRPHNAAGFDRDDRAALNLLLPHLSRALQLQRRLGDYRNGHRIAVEALNEMGCGVILVGSVGQILFANSAAEGMLRRADGIVSRHGGLHASNGPQDEELQRRIEVSGRAAIGAAFGSGGVLALQRTNAPPLSLLICPVPQDALDLGMLRHPVIIFVDEPDSRRPPAPSLLREIYGLTPAEARLAAALLAGGRLKDYADEAGITLSTAKTQLKQIFAKTGDNRQSDLIRTLVSNLVIRMRSRPSESVRQ
jgi:DNA-binding CsgD family transcriptional regulator